MMRSFSSVMLLLVVIAGTACDNRSRSVAASQSALAVCASDADCGAGSLCSHERRCVATCSDAKPCPGGSTCVRAPRRYCMR